jgi:hypothetical protein
MSATDAHGRRDALAVVDGLLASSSDAPLDAASFVSAASETLPLETLRLALGSRIAAVKADLISAINSDYSSFVSLSAALEGSDSSVLRLQRPLSAAAGQLAEVSAAAAARRREVEAAGAAARRAAAVSAAAERLADAQEALMGAQRALRAVAVGGRGAGAGAAGGGAWDVDGGGVVGAWGGGGIAAAAAAATATTSSPAEDGGGAVAALLPAPSLAAASAWLAEAPAFARAHLLARAARLLRAARAALSGCSAAAAGAGGDGELPPQLSAGLVATHEALEEAWGGALEPALRDATHGALGEVVEAGSGGGGGGGGGIGEAGAPPLPPGGPHATLYLCLDAWAVCGRVGEGEGACVARVVKPLLGRLLAQGRLDEGGARGSYKGVHRVLEDYLSEAVAAGDWLRVASGAGGGAGDDGSGIPAPPPPGGLAGVLIAAAYAPGFSPVAGLLWAPLVDHIASALPSFFSPANPSVFHGNYGALSAFFSRLRVAAGALGEALGGGEGALGAGEALLRHPSTVALAGVWRPKLGIYGALRAQEAAQRAERALHGGGAGGARGGGAGAGTGAGTGAGAGAGAGAALVVNVSELMGGGGGGGWRAPGAVCAALCRAAAAAPTPLLALPLPSAVTLALPGATGGVWAALHAAWAPATNFLPPLLPTTLLLSQQLVGRFAAWVACGVGVVGVHSDAAPALVAALCGAGGGGGGGGGGALTAAPAPASPLQLLPLAPAVVKGLSPASLAAALAAAAAAAPTSSPVPAAAAPAVPHAAAPAPAAPTPPAPTLPTTDIGWWTETILGFYGGAAATPAPAAAAATAAAAALNAALLLAAAGRDCLGLGALSLALVGIRALESSGVAAPGECGVRGAESERALLAPALAGAEQLQRLGAYAHALCGALVGRQCAAAAGGARALPAALKALPTGAAGAPPRSNPSPYVAAVTAPLRAFLARDAAAAGGAAAAAANPQLRAAALAAATAAAEALEAAVAATLDSLSAMESSLEWLKKGGAGGGGAGGAGGAGGSGGGGGGGDSARIGAQLATDVRALGKELGGEALGGALGVAWDAAAGALEPAGGAGAAHPAAAQLCAAVQRALKLVAPYNSAGAQ